MVILLYILLFLVGFVLLFCISAFINYLILTTSRPIRKLYEKRKSESNFCNYYDLPYKTVDIVLALEDAKFFYHKGYDLNAIKRAFHRNLKQKKLVFGGSTITQQLAKNLYLKFEPRLFRKLTELLIAQNIEKNMSKIEILEMYLNVIYYGNNQYGLYDAANYYFDLRYQDLNVNQTFFLMCLLSAPTAANPLKNPEIFMNIKKKKVGQILWIDDDKKYLKTILDHTPDNLDEQLVKRSNVADNKIRMINEKYNKKVYRV